MKKQKPTEEVEALKCESFKKPKKKKYIYFSLGLGVLVLLIACSLTQISVSNNLATQGITLAKIQTEIDATKQQNMILAEQLYTASSYTHIASQAATLGFVEAKAPIFISNQTPIALKP